MVFEGEERKDRLVANKVVDQGDHGLADVTRDRDTLRIKEFRLSDAIVYSYFRD